MTNNERYPGNDIHETAIIYNGVAIGTGNIIGPYCIIGAPPEFKGKEFYSGKVIIGDNNRITGLVTIDSGTEHSTYVANDCYIMKGVHLGHDVAVLSSTTISCGAKIGGHAVISSNCNIGLNAVIHQKQFIKQGCMIGMGAVVTKGLITDSFKKYVGNPAKLLGDNSGHPEYNIFIKESL